MRQEISLYLDVVRFSAAMVVFLGHASGRAFTGGLLWQLHPYLQTAVIMFFVLSGFVIGYVANTKERNIAEYWVARTARLSSIVLPALALTLVCDSIGLNLDRGFYFNGPWGYQAESQIPNYLLSVFLVQNVWNMDLNPGINEPFWSLSFELMYYAIFSAAFFLRGWWRIIFVVLLCVVAGPTIVALMPIWLLGYGCYVAFTRHGDFLSRHQIPFSIISLTCLLALVFVSPWIRKHVDFHIPHIGRGDVLGDYFYAIMFSLHLMFSLPLLGYFKNMMIRYSSSIKWASSMTFALYLFHRPLIQLLAILAPDDPGSISARLVVIGGTMLVVATFGIWCERRKFWVKKFLENVVVPRLRAASGLA